MKKTSFLLFSSSFSFWRKWRKGIRGEDGLNFVLFSWISRNNNGRRKVMERKFFYFFVPLFLVKRKKKEKDEEK
jgi:hypothetical protein